MYDDTITLHSVIPGPSTRTDRLRYALHKATHGVPVTLAAMRRCLTAAEFRAYQDEFLASYPRPTASERLVLRKYKHDLHQGDLLHARALKLNAVGMQAMKRRAHIRAAQRLYCHAHERLVALLSLNPQLAYLFDRIVAEGENADEPEGMPRYADSRSEHAMQVSQQPCTADMAGIQESALRWSMKALAPATTTRRTSRASAAGSPSERV